MATKKTTKSYQEKSAALEEILNKLQSDDLDIDKAIHAYEEGMRLISDLETYLSEAENTVTKIAAQFDRKK